MLNPYWKKGVTQNAHFAYFCFHNILAFEYRIFKIFVSFLHNSWGIKGDRHNKREDPMLRSQDMRGGKYATLHFCIFAVTPFLDNNLGYLIEYLHSCVS